MEKIKYYETIEEFAKELKKLNPKATIYVWCGNKSQSRRAERRIYTDTDIEQLKLPEGVGSRGNAFTNGVYDTNTKMYESQDIAWQSIKRLNLKDELVRDCVKEIKLSEKTKAKGIVEKIKNKVDKRNTQEQEKAL